MPLEHAEAAVHVADAQVELNRANELAAALGADVALAITRLIEQAQSVLRAGNDLDGYDVGPVVDLAAKVNDADRDFERASDSAAAQRHLCETLSAVTGINAR